MTFDTPLNTAIPNAPCDDALAARLERLRALRSAWGALAPAGVEDGLEAIAERGRALTEHLAKITASKSDAMESEIQEIDVLLGEFEASIRDIAAGIAVSQLRSTLPARRANDRRGLLDLLDVLIGEDAARSKSLTERIATLDYLITLLCTRANGSVGDDPVSLTPRLLNLCTSAEEANDLCLDEVESEFFAAANLDSEELRKELQQRTLRRRKAELGLTFFAPRVLRAIVTYNAALLRWVAEELLDAGDWGIVPGETPSAAPLDAGTCSVFESRPLRNIAAAVRRRADAGTPEPTPIDRIAWALDFDALDENERKALCSQMLGTAEDPRGTAILVGLLSRSLAVLSIELQEAGLPPDEISDVWVAELCAVFQNEINRNIANHSYQIACALSELKSKFLLAPRTGPRRVDPLIARPVAEATDAAVPTKTESARKLVQDALVQSRNATKGRRITADEIPWARLAQIAAGMMVVTATVVFLFSTRNPDQNRIRSQDLARLSPHLENGQRGGDGLGNAFVGRIDDAWLELPIEKREKSAEELVERLRAQGMLQIMIYDADDRIRIQAIGSQPTKIL